MEFLQTLTRHIHAKDDRNRTCLGQVRLTYICLCRCVWYTCRGMWYTCISTSKVRRCRTWKMKKSL